MTDPFREAEATFSRLLERFNDKKISPQEFSDSLKQLRIKDDEGRFWVIGARSGKWYAYENGEWIEAKPPSQMEKKAICIACGFENDLEADFCARCGSGPGDGDPGAPEVAYDLGPEPRVEAAAQAADRPPGRRRGRRPLARRQVVLLVLRRPGALQRAPPRPPGRRDRALRGLRRPPARLLCRAPRRPLGRLVVLALRRRAGLRLGRGVRRGRGRDLQRDPLARRRAQIPPLLTSASPRAICPSDSDSSLGE